VDGAVERPDQHLNSSGSEADEASKASDTSSKDSELETKSANMTHDKTPQVTWQQNNMHNAAYTEDLSPHTIGQAMKLEVLLDDTYSGLSLILVHYQT